MMKWAMSAAAAGLLRGILNRASIDRDRILLTDFRSVDWRSLTFEGERHVIGLRLPAPDADVVATRLLDGLEEAEIPIPGHALVDIAAARRRTNPDSSITIELEALTIAD